MIALDNVSIAAGAFQLRNVNLHVPAGSYAVLMGKTGSGKTTLLEAICGLRAVTAGRVLLQGEDRTRWKPARRGIGYVPQDRALFPSMTVWEHLAFALRVRRWPWQTLVDRVVEMATLLGVQDLLERKPDGLSGGEAQRVALGRALSFHPQVLLLDEPLSALDQETRGDMQELLSSLHKRTGVTTLHVTHDVSEAQRLADVILTIEKGAVRVERTAGVLDLKPSAEASAHIMVKEPG